MLRHVAVIAGLTVFVSSLSAAAQPAEYSLCQRGSFKVGQLYALTEQKQRVACWASLKARPGSVLRTQFEKSFQDLRRTGKNATFRYIIAFGNSPETAISVQSRDLIISDGLSGKEVSDAKVRLHRPPVLSVCNTRNVFETDSSSVVSGSFTIPVRDYVEYHSRTTDLLTQRGVLRDFHFRYVRREDERGRRVVCIDTDSVREGNLNQFRFEDLISAKLPEDRSLLAEFFRSIFSTDAQAGNRSADGTSAKYVYSNLQSKNVWNREDTAWIDFDLIANESMQVVSLSDLEQRDRSGVPLPPDYYLIRWTRN